MAKTIADMIGDTIFRKTVEAVTKPHVPVDNAKAATVAHEVEKELKPVIVNATNSEPWFQSRVILGSTAAFLAAVADLMAMFAAGDFDAGRAAPSIAVVLGTLFALYGRVFGSKLKPLGQ